MVPDANAIPPLPSDGAAPAPPPAVVRVRDPGELVAAVPVLIGFHPHESLVLISTGGASGRRLGLTLRVDLPPPAHTAALCTTAVETLMRGEPAGAAVIVVSGADGDAPPRPDVAAAAVAALAARGVDVHTAVWAERTGAAARWACYESCGCSGVLPDPAATPLAAASVAEGAVVFADRRALEGLVAPADPERLARRDTLLTGAVDAAPDRCDPDLAMRVAEGHALVEAALADAVAGRLALDDARVVALAEALALPIVRDAALLRSAVVGPAAAEQLWAALARETPDPEAAEPAALLAACALLRGAGGLANVALDRAEQAWPAHRLTGLLRAIAEAGLRPKAVRAMLLGGDDGDRDDGDRDDGRP